MVEKIRHYSIENPASVYDEEAMTALELAGRTAKKVNEVIDQSNKLVTDTNDWMEETTQKIPEQIANEVNTHIQNGTFDAQIDEHTETIVNHLNETDAHVSNEIGRMTVELQNTETDLNKRVDNLILNSGAESSAEIVDARNGYATLGTYLRTMFNNIMIPDDYTAGTYDLNNIFESTTIVTKSANVTNAPTGWAEGVTLIKVEGYGYVLSATGHPQYGLQLIYNRDFTRGYFRRYYYDMSGTSVTFTEWELINPECQILYEPALSVDKIFETGAYMYGTNNVEGAPITNAFTLSVMAYGDWIVQNLQALWKSEMWFRTGRRTGGTENFADDVAVSWNVWQQIATHNDVYSTQGNAGYKIVNFGDSIFGAEQGATSVSNYLATATGAEVVNVAFGGCHMSTHWGDDWKPFSMWELADAVASGDYSEQVNKVTEGYSDMPSYFVDAVNRLKEIDFSTVDIITICYGTNDYTSGDAIGAGTYDKTTVIGALRYSIETILNAYPNIRVVIIAPCYRFWMDSNGAFTEDSDTKTYNGYTLPTLVEAMQAVGKEYHSPVVNPYYDMGVNKHNCHNWSDDGTHPNTTGRKQLAKLIANTIKGM